MMVGNAVHMGFRGHLLVSKFLYSYLITEMGKDDPEIKTLLDQASRRNCILPFLVER